MLTKEQMIGYIASGEKPKADWRIGTEHEKFPFRKSDHSPIAYDGEDGIGAILNGLVTEFNWQPIYEGENVIALSRDGCSISLEPGSQFELSGAALKTLHQTCDEVHTHLHEVRTICDRLGVGMLGLGFHPTAQRDDINWMPKGRYRIMRDYMPKRGNLGLDMMTRSCTVQVNLDYSSEADMVKKLRVSLALQPLAMALFANSPFTERKPNGFQSYRTQIWTDTDPDRTGPLELAFDEGFGYEAYVDHALKVPMYFLYRGGKYLDVSGKSFVELNEGRLEGFENETITVDDWENHLSVLFPDVRVKKFLEMRGADAGPWRALCALPAFWVGLLYDQTALDAAWDLAKNWTSEDRVKLHDSVPRLGLHDSIAGKPLWTLAEEVLEISQAGLAARGILSESHRDETQYIGPLFELLRKRQSLSDQLLAKYAGEWGEDIDRVFTDCAF